MLVRTFCVLGVFLLAHGQADGQIRVDRDADGRLLLTNRAPASPAAAPARAAERPGATRTAPTPTRFEPLVREHAARQGLRPSLVRAVIQVESGFDPRARSHKGAMGLMQLMPATAQDLGVRDPYDPAENVRGGTTYLRQLLDRYGGDETLALAAYNAGATTVDRYAGVPPFPETRQYVERVGLAAGSPQSPAGRIYRTEDVVGERRIPRFSNVPPR